MKKVIFYMPNFHHGGAEGIMVEVANYFSQNNIEVVFVVVKAEGVLSDKLDKKIKVIDLNLTNQWLSIAKLPFVIRKEKPDYIFSTMKESNFIAIFTKLLAFSKAKNIIREANTVSQQIQRENKFHQKIKNKIIFHFYKYAQKIIVLSKSMGDDLLTVTNIEKEKLEVIPNFVDIEKVNRLAQEPVPKEEEYLFSKTNTFISVSRLFPQKNYHFLLEALSRYKENGNDFNFIALGDGPLKDELEEYSKSLGLQNNCYFLGYRENPYKYLSRSDLFILPSLYEGMSNSLIQAMAFNIKVLVSDSQPTSLELIEDYKLGSFYTQNNIDDCVLSIDKVVNKKIKNQTTYLASSKSLEKYMELVL